MAGIIVAAAVLSGLLSLIGSYYQPAIAQQDMTGNATTTTTGRGGAQSSACAPTQSGEGGATTAGAAAAGNQSTTSEIRMHIEQACMAAQNNDTQGVLMNLTLALNALGGGDVTQGNMTTATTAGGNAITGSEDGISVGRTSAADGSDEIEEDDAADGNDDAGERNSSTDANRRETDTDDEDSECGGVTVGGTSAADDYGCPPDPDY